MLKLPADFIQKYRKLLGEDQAKVFFAALTAEPQKAFRINSLKKSSVSYPLDQPVADIPNAWYGKVGGLDPESVSGTVYSQDPVAMFPAAIAGVQPGERVLDLCAAPGGKSTALGEQLKGKGVLVANEISRTRAKALRENLERWGITNALITSEKPEKLAQHFLHFFNKIVVDAPCSGEGMFRKNAQAAEYWSQDYVLLCQKRQQEILTAAVKMLQAGGELIYSTCTFAPEEDEQVVDWLIDEFGFQVIPIAPEKAKVDHGHPDWASGRPDMVNTLRFWPNDGIGEGQFVAKLKLPSSSSTPSAIPQPKQRKPKRPKTSTLSKDEAAWVDSVLSQFNWPVLLANWRQNCQVSQDHVFIPTITPEELHFKVINNGLELGLLKKKRFEPGHQLALVLGQVKQSRVVELTQAEYLSYLHGESLHTSSDLRGFVLVSCRSFIFSFGKITGNGTLKNFYPKGLRILKKD